MMRQNHPQDEVYTVRLAEVLESYLRQYGAHPDAAWYSDTKPCPNLEELDDLCAFVAECAYLASNHGNKKVGLARMSWRPCNAEGWSYVVELHPYVHDLFPSRIYLYIPDWLE